MANINLVNLNDAVYRMLNPAWPWNGFESTALSPANFNAVNCPLLHNHDRREVVTYKDWVSILAGNPNVTNTTSDAASRCLALCDSAQRAGLKPWARTFGKFAGPGGKPLAEVKPLDEMFWYYDALDRQLRYTLNNVNNPCRVMHWYHNNGWKWRWAETGITVEPGARVTLQPGVYGASSMAYSNAGTGFSINDSTGPTPGSYLLQYSDPNGGVWRYMNSIFFVDSPVDIEIMWSGSGSHVMQGIVFRITPPGYWC